MIIKLNKLNNKILIDFEKDLEKDSEIEDGYYYFFKSDNGFFLIKKNKLDKKEQNQKQEEKHIKIKDLEINKIKFTKEEYELSFLLFNCENNERIKENFLKKINKDQIEILKTLIKKEIIKIFIGKNKKEYYSLKKEIFFYFYNLVKEKENLVKGKEIKNDSLEILFKEGYILIEDEKKAQELSKEIRNQKLQEQIIGTKSFDGKYYIITKDFFNKNKEKILNLIKKEQGVGLDSLILKKQETKAIIFILLENGEIIEKQKGKFFCVN